MEDDGLACCGRAMLARTVGCPEKAVLKTQMGGWSLDFSGCATLQSDDDRIVEFCVWRIL